MNKAIHMKVKKKRESVQQALVFTVFAVFTSVYTLLKQLIPVLIKCMVTLIEL